MVVGVLGTLGAVLGEAIAVRAGVGPDAALLDLAIGLTYLYGGLAIWAHDPSNRTGPLMSLVGLTWFIGTLAGSGIPVLDNLARALQDTSTIILFALVLAYPNGRLETRVDRVAVSILAIGATALKRSSRCPCRSSPTRATTGCTSACRWRS